MGCSSASCMNDELEMWRIDLDTHDLAMQMPRTFAVATTPLSYLNNTEVDAHDTVHA